MLLIRIITTVKRIFPFPEYGNNGKVECGERIVTRCLTLILMHYATA